MQHQYYIVIDGQSAGPFEMNQLYVQKINPDTLVWRQGLPEWVKASELPELNDLFFKPSPEKQKTPENPWFAMINGTQVGPATVAELISKGLNESTPVWRAGIPDWVAASSQPEIMEVLLNRNNPSDNNTQVPPYGNYRNNGYQNNGYQNSGYQNSGYQNSGYQNNGYQNNDVEYKDLQTQAIVVTIVAFFVSCIGAIFGIIAIVNSNKANNFYRQGDYGMAAHSNSTAKTMIKVAWILAAVGFVFNIITFIGMLSSF